MIPKFVKEVFRLLNRFIKSHLSILISGPTGSGKTELQKYLVSLIDQDEKIILIEDSYETCLKSYFLIMILQLGLQVIP